MKGKAKSNLSPPLKTLSHFGSSLCWDAAIEGIMQKISLRSENGAGERRL